MNEYEEDAIACILIAAREVVRQCGHSLNRPSTVDALANALDQWDAVRGTTG